MARVEKTNSFNTAAECREMPSTKRTKLSYLDKCSEWDFMKNNKSFNLSLMINGSKCKLVKQDQQIINIQETCAFDSILQLVVSGIVTHAAYRNALISSSNDIIQLAKSKIMENYFPYIIINGLPFYKMYLYLKMP